MWVYWGDEWGSFDTPTTPHHEGQGFAMKTVGIILNFFLPGVGTIVIGKAGQGVTQLCLYGLGVLCTATLIGAIIGIPLMLAAWIWAMVTTVSSEPQPMQVMVIHQQAAPTPPPAPTTTTDGTS